MASLIAPPASCLDNWPMAVSSWQRRIERAQELAGQHPFAAEILGFYIHVARFQEDLHRQLSVVLQSPATSVARGLSGVELSELSPRFESFLSLAEAHGPQQLSKLSRELRVRGPSFWTELLNGAWNANGASDAQSLLALAFLQPYAEMLRARASVRPSQHTYAVCPFCNRRPADRRAAADGRWRCQVAGLFFLSERMGVPPHRLPRLRRGERPEAPRLYSQ